MRKRPVSQYASERVGIAIYEAGVLTDATGDVTLEVIREGAASTVGPGQIADRDDLGLYSYVLTSTNTSAKGDCEIIWDYTVAGQTRQYHEFFTVTDPMPYWDSLESAHRDLVLDVYHKVSDTFDSKEGGPYLWELYQTQWNAFETIARLMTTDAVTYINLSHQPAFVPGYNVGAGMEKPFPEGWFGLLLKATYVEFLKHISRSYIEIPALAGSNAARLDRSRYRQEWSAEYKMEKEELDQMLRYFKRKFLVGSRRSLLIQGGAFGRMAFGGAAARPHWAYSVAMY